MGETRAYLTVEADDRAQLEVFENVTMYGGRRGKEPVLSETVRIIDDGRDYVMGAQPEQPFIDADAVLARHGFQREGVWVGGDVITGTYARVTRTA